MALLVVSVPGVVESDGVELVAADKTLSGLAAIAARWPGEMAFVTHFSPLSDSAAMAAQSATIADLPYHVVLTRDRVAAINSLRPDLVTLTLTMSEMDIARGIGAPFSVMGEYDLQTRWEWVVAETGRAPRSRRAAGLLRLEMQYIRALRRSASLQMNGWPTFLTYRRHNSDTLLFFDSRVDQQMLDDTPVVSGTKGDVLTLAFSGRWIRPKGFRDALEAFSLARREVGNAVRLRVYGAGPEESCLSQFPDVDVRGAVDYTSEWVPAVRHDVDALLIPHRQSDPACTYLEGAALGAPFISYDNRAARHLDQQESMGWTSPMGDTHALADRIMELVRDPQLLDSRRVSAQRFMQAHTMEHEFDKRVEHLVRTLPAAAGSHRTVAAA